MAVGGYRSPKNPAPVSGPGAMSKRTDGIKSQSPMDMPDAAYGEQKEMRGIQQAAPMAAASMPKITPLDAPTERPDEPGYRWHGSWSGSGSRIDWHVPLGDGAVRD